jgi:hypothetical protein
VRSLFLFFTRKSLKRVIFNCENTYFSI